MNGSIDSGNFSVRGYLSLIQKDSVIHMHGLAVYVKNSADFYVFDWLHFIQCLISFSLVITFFIFMHEFNAISSIIDKILSINQSGDVFAFGDLNIHHKDWLTYSGGTDRLGELSYNFSIIKILPRWFLIRWLAFQLRSLTVTLSQSCPFGFLSFF